MAQYDFAQLGKKGVLVSSKRVVTDAVFYHNSGFTLIFVTVSERFASGNFMKYKYWGVTASELIGPAHLVDVANHGGKWEKLPDMTSHASYQWDYML